MNGATMIPDERSSDTVPDAWLVVGIKQERERKHVP